MSAPLAASVAATAAPDAVPGAGGQAEPPPPSRIQAIRVALAIAVVLVLMFPIYWMLRTSVASQAELSDFPVPLWPRDWLLLNYVTPWQDWPFARWLTNSVVIATASVVLTLVINLCAGYAFAKLRFPGRNLLFLLILSTLMVPVQVIMVPQFQIVVDLDLLNNVGGVILPRLAEAFGLFMARQFFVSIPDELIEAGQIDGASHLRVFWSIVLPLSKPLIAVLVIFTFMWRWNEFAWPLIVLTDAESYTLPVGLQFLIQQFGNDYGPLLAMSFVSMLPMLIVFGFFQRFFVEGVARTGIK